MTLHLHGIDVGEATDAMREEGRNPTIEEIGRATTPALRLTQQLLGLVLESWTGEQDEFVDGVRGTFAYANAELARRGPGGASDREARGSVEAATGAVRVIMESFEEAHYSAIDQIMAASMLLERVVVRGARRGRMVEAYDGIVERIRPHIVAASELYEKKLAVLEAMGISVDD
jgi:hypothetical protein